ncbi:MAG: hypothetical protein WDM85_00700 [Caulobacteraceae bacterium]
MLIAIERVLSAQQVAEVRQDLLRPADAWVDGRATAGYQGAPVKFNQQIDEGLGGGAPVPRGHPRGAGAPPAVHTARRCPTRSTRRCSIATAKV